MKDKDSQSPYSILLYWRHKAARSDIYIDVLLPIEGDKKYPNGRS